MKRIIYSRPDGAVMVVVPVINTFEDISEDQALQRAQKDVPPDAVNVQVVDESDIPSDRTFRDGWVQSGAQIVHDMPKCRAIHRERLRALRKSKFEPLDAQWMKSMATGDVAGAAAAEAKRQELRDAPQYPAIDAALTPLALKAAVPDVLK